MNGLQIFNYQETPIEFEVINGEVFANATIMCQAFNKMPYSFLRLESTNRYLEALRERNAVEYIITKNGGINTGTWIHEKLIIRLASWLSVSFEIWCDETIAELLKGKSKELTRKEILTLALDSEERALLAESKLLEVQPKVEAFDRVIDNSTVYTLDTVSDIVNIGRTKLSSRLKEIGWAIKDSSKGTSSTRSAEENGFAKTFFETIKQGQHEFKVKKIVITKRGLDYLINNYNKIFS
jgi:phage antirepressor YoqD-like protein